MRQSLELHCDYLVRIAAADSGSRACSAHSPRGWIPPRSPYPWTVRRITTRKRRKKSGLPENFDLRAEAYQLSRVDVTQIPGLETNDLPLFTEVGRELWRGRREGNHRAGQIFRLAAQLLHRSPATMGDYHRPQERHPVLHSGPAWGRFRPLVWRAADVQCRQRGLTQQARRFGFQVVPLENSMPTITA